MELTARSKTVAREGAAGLLATAESARSRLADGPAPHLFRGPCTTHVRRLDSAPPTLEAFRRLQGAGACLLQSRTSHPGARHSIIALRPVLELTAHAYHLEEQVPDGSSQLVAGPPWERLADWLEAFRHDAGTPLPFAGGWVGFLAHEASSWFLQTPTPDPAPPARPKVPWAHFRLYADALVVDERTGETFLAATDFEGEGQAEARLGEWTRRLRSTLAGAPAPHARDSPTATMDPETFQRRVEQLRALVGAGDCFQANLTASFAYPWVEPATPEGLVSLYEEYASSNPGPWGGFYEAPGVTLLSSSPELLADLRGDRLRLRPIAGTRPRGRDAREDAQRASELAADAKERAEHAMLVDLARNDAASVCEPGTVHVPNLSGLERYRHVMHLVSEVEGTTPSDLSIRRLLEAVFPGGTVTGCPKRRALRRIAELEQSPRGPYTGTLGYVSFNGASQWNLLIRTLVATPSHLVAHAGCGIVEGSRAPMEWEELVGKARAQVEAALGRATPALAETGCGRVDPGPSWSMPDAGPKLEGRRVLLVDFEDSFVHNLADYCRRLGAETLVWSAHDPVEPAWYRPPTHVILSPGPGRPEDFPSVRHHLARAQRARAPILGVCLGHQAIGQLLGAEVVRHAQTVHGSPSRVEKTPEGRSDEVVGPWRGSTAGRYHSLVVRRLPESLLPLAALEDATVMAMRHRFQPIWGLQFHPESILTQSGMDLLRAFLEVEPDG